MGKIISLVIFVVLYINSFAQNKFVFTIANAQQLSATSTNNESVFVTDQERGGYFIHSQSLLPIDEGVVFSRKAGGVWIRSFDKSQGVNPCWWGAIGNGVHDDLPAINAATKYCQENQTILQFPSGVFRITSPWIIGAKTVQEKDLLQGKFTEAPSFNMEQHQLARTYAPMIIRGGVNTCIYGDFNSNTLTAIIYYNVHSNGAPKSPSTHFYTHEISNIGIFGQGFFKGTMPTPPSYSKMNNNQIGLVMLYANLPTIQNCMFSGLKYGLICNTTYFASIRNCDFELCETGLYTNGFNANLIENVVGFFCKLLANITGSQLVVNNFNAESCESALQFNGSNIIMNGVYCENTDLKNPNSYQIILGADNVENSNPKISTTNVMINTITMTANGRDLILLKGNMKELKINSGNINGNIISTSEQSSIVTNNLRGSYKIIGKGKFITTE